MAQHVGLSLSIHSVARPAVYMFTFLLAVYKGVQVFMYSIAIGEAELTVDHSMFIPAKYSCVTYQILELVVQLLLPCILYYTMVKDTKYWTELALGMASPKSTSERTHLLTTGKFHIT